MMMAVCVLMAVGMTRGVMAIKVKATNRTDGCRGDGNGSDGNDDFGDAR